MHENGTDELLVIMQHKFYENGTKIVKNTNILPPTACH